MFSSFPRDPSRFPKLLIAYYTSVFPRRLFGGCVEDAVP
jgi:hypothetical protein